VCVIAYLPTWLCTTKILYDIFYIIISPLLRGDRPDRRRRRCHTRVHDDKTCDTSDEAIVVPCCWTTFWKLIIHSRVIPIRIFHRSERAHALREQERNNCESAMKTNITLYDDAVLLFYFFFIYLFFAFLQNNRFHFQNERPRRRPRQARKWNPPNGALPETILDERKVRYDLHRAHVYPPIRLSETRRKEKGIRIRGR